MERREAQGFGNPSFFGHIRCTIFSKKNVNSWEKGERPKTGKFSHAAAIAFANTQVPTKERKFCEWNFWKTLNPIIVRTMEQNQKEKGEKESE